MTKGQFAELRKGVVKRRTKRRLSLFINGINLDRATRRLDKKIDLSRLVEGLCGGLTPEIARYYTLVPYEDDARQFAFLEAVERAGLEVIVKRLPPKGVKRQVSMDVHIATDLMSFSLNRSSLLQEGFSQENYVGISKVVNGNTVAEEPIPDEEAQSVKKIAVLVCPSREITYAIHTAHCAGVETHLADFGLYGTSDGWKGVDRWIDLSTSETIWRD
ncbi:MAG: NYN domain-containing protein [Deltaproteobacteria bacterium]|nr:NYN domain-containing protein [Deltaproteobacteria bacterium]